MTFFHPPDWFVEWYSWVFTSGRKYRIINTLHGSFLLADQGQFIGLIPLTSYLKSYGRKSEIYFTSEIYRY